MESFSIMYGNLIIIRYNGLKLFYCFMNINLSDAHIHLCDEKMKNNLDCFIEESLKIGIKLVLNNCTNFTELQFGMKILHQYRNKLLIFNSAGLPPQAVNKENYKPFLALIESLIKKSIFAIGETGLDNKYNLDNDLYQKDSFISHIKLARKNSLPIIVHCRGRVNECLEILKNEYADKVMLHSFHGTYKEMMLAVKLGFYVSISGIATFLKEDEFREVVKKIPLSNLLIETDAPYLAPEPFRGKICHPKYILETYKVISRLKNISLIELYKQVYLNLESFLCI